MHVSGDDIAKYGEIDRETPASRDPETAIATARKR
jgi:hypothetical protein